MAYCTCNEIDEYPRLCPIHNPRLGKQERRLDSFGLLCDTLDLLLSDSLPNIPHKHLQLDKGCIVVSSGMAINGKFHLYLYNDRFDTLVDQSPVDNLTQLFDLLYTWGDY